MQKYSVFEVLQGEIKPSQANTTPCHLIKDYAVIAIAGVYC